MEKLKMQLSEYKLKAMRTCGYARANKDIRENFDIELCNAVMGLCGEAGECIDLVKKYIHQGHELNTEKLIDELGDVLWYIAEAADALRIPMDTIAQRNIDKLIKRYPEGFTTERSINREG
jgi:NTP pyrophosphatase (non-canonical NTP hydrolase)